MVPTYYVIEICSEESLILRRRGEFYDAVSATVLCTEVRDGEPQKIFGYFRKREWERVKVSGGTVYEIPLVSR